MAQILNLDPPMTSTYFRHGESTIAVSQESLLLLEKTEWCGLFMLIDKVLEQDLSESTARLLLGLLRGIAKSPVLVLPSVQDDPQSFVKKMLIVAVEIVDGGSSSKPTLVSSALALNDARIKHDQNPECFGKLVSSWHTFILYYFRDRLYQYLHR